MSYDTGYSDELVLPSTGKTGKRMQVAAHDESGRQVWESMTANRRGLQGTLRVKASHLL